VRLAGTGDDILARVTSMTVLKNLRPVVRSSLRLALPAALVLTVLLAGPATADVPKGWSDPDDVTAWQFIVVLFLAPLGVAALISLAVYLPALARGEKIAPNSAPVDDQWFGGPRGGRAELEQSESKQEGTGGASGTW
jgi:hypothetical protein